MIITIGRECGCLADELGRKLSEKYKIPCYMRAEIEKYAKEKKVYDKYPFFFGEIPTDYLMSAIDETVLQRIRKTPHDVLSQLLENQDCIVVGRASNCAFSDRKDVVRVFLCGDMEYRIYNIMKKHGVDKQKAKKIIMDTDERRNRYHNYYTGRIRGYAGDYDLCIDVSKISIDKAVSLIASYIEGMKRGI